MNIRRSWFVILLMAIVVLAATQSRGVTVGQPELCGGTVDILNGGFESPTVLPNEGVYAVPDSWTGIGDIHINGPDASNPDQSVRLGGPSNSGSISQTLTQSALSGSAVTFTIMALYSGTVTFNGETQPFAGSGTGWVVTMASFNIPESATLPLTLTLAGGTNRLVAIIDNISGTYTRPCPSPTPTDTPMPSSTPTETPIPSSTPTETPIPSSTPTETPEPTTVPLADVQLTATGDPRFPVIGSAAIPGEPGLTYAIGSPPTQGKLVLTPNGAFTYTANSYLVKTDSFTVTASDGSGDSAVVTVNVVLTIDPTVSTKGTVKPGTGGGGGTISDPRSPGTRTPTPVPNGDDSDCERCD